MTPILTPLRLGAPVATAALLWHSTALANPTDAAPCRSLPDPAQRLACYDRVFDHPQAAAAPVVLPAAAPPASAPTPLANAAPDPAPESAQAANMLSRFWELDRADKRGTFFLKTYQPNFVLPLHSTSSINNAPASPTHPSTSTANYRPTEAKFQLSLRAKIWEDALLPGADLWGAYTQRSFWQLWNEPASSPFRSTDYQPELIYVIPVPRELDKLPGGWHWRMLQLGWGHQSNGQSDPQSRSWNFAQTTLGVERGELSVRLRVNRRTSERGVDDNPHLTDYIGKAELSASWAPGLSIATLTHRNTLKLSGRGSTQLDWSYPVDSKHPQGLRWYVQFFSGYGETLLDYNHRQNSMGLGVSLFQY